MTYKPFVENQKTAFGELLSAELTPIVQVQFPYSINTDIWEVRDNNGTSSVVNNKANLSTGAAANQSSTILTRVPVKYNPGQGAVIRFTAVYTIGVANSTQWVGIGNSTDGYFFGYSGAIFGILRRQGGVPETRRLAITTKASEIDSITITLNDDTIAVDVTNGADTTVTANEIAAVDYSNVGEGWEVHSMGASVFFTSFSDGAKSGTYDLTDATNAAGTFTQSLAGVSANETGFVAQTDWNEDQFLGVSDPTVLDPTKGNVYQIRYQWLGFGEISFWIEEPFSGVLTLVHRIKYANVNTIPSIDNPTLPLCASVKNISNTSDIVIQIGSMGGFVEGRDSLLGLPHSLSVEKGSVGTDETPIMTIHSHDIYKGSINRVRARFTVGTVSIDGAKPATVRIRKNATLVGGSFSALDSNKSIMHVDTSATSISGGDILFSETVAKVGSITIDLEKLGIDLIAPDFLTLTVEASSTTVDTVSGLNWLELF